MPTRLSGSALRWTVCAAPTLTQRRCSASPRPALPSSSPKRPDWRSNSAARVGGRDRRRTLLHVVLRNMLSELNQIMTFLIGLLQRFRIWISDGVERRVRRNILDKDSNIILIGTGVHHAISDTERAIG